MRGTGGDGRSSNRFRTFSAAALRGTLVPINIGCSLSHHLHAPSHSADPFLHNCYRDYAQRNARELADLVGGQNIP